MGEKYWTHLKLKNGDRAIFVPPAPDGERLGGINQDEKNAISNVNNNFGKISKSLVNIFDKENTPISHLYPRKPTASEVSAGVGVTYNSTTNCESVIIPCKPNTVYTVTKNKATKRFAVSCFAEYPSVGDPAPKDSIVYENTWTQISLTTGPNDQYLMVYFYYKTEDTLSSDAIRSGMRIYETNVSVSNDVEMTALDNEARIQIDILKKDIATIKAVIAELGNTAQS